MQSCWNVLLTLQTANQHTPGPSHQSLNAAAADDTSRNDLSYDDGDDNGDVEYDSSTAMMGDGVAMGSPMSRLLYDVGHGMFRGGEDLATGVQEDDIDESSTGDVLITVITNGTVIKHDIDV